MPFHTCIASVQFCLWLWGINRVFIFTPSILHANFGLKLLIRPSQI